MSQACGRLPKMTASHSETDTGHTTHQEWTAPTVDRQLWPLTGGERETLVGLLDFHRRTLRHKCAGLTAAQLKRRSVATTELSLLGLVRHLTNVERHWFWNFAGVLEQYHHTGDTSFSGWTDISGVPEADAAADLAEFERTCQRSHELVADASLDDTFVTAEELDRVFSLRFVYLHMIEEYARHNGHADLLREAIDGATGQ